MTQTPGQDLDRQAIEGAARLLARLLLCELDAATLAGLRAPSVAAALAELDIDVPAPDRVEELAAAFCESFVQPADGAPLVESLWIDGQYEGGSTRVLRQLAAAAGLEFSREEARGLPPDHLGTILLLWCETRERAPAVAERLARDHLCWAERALAPVAARGGFYGAVARATVRLCDVLRAG